MHRSLIATLFSCLLLLSSTVLLAAGGSKIPLDAANNRLNDFDSIKRGAKLFTQYCASCHSMKYLRYSELAEKLAWSAEDIDSQLGVNGRAKLFDPMIGGMDEAAAKAAFGTVVPDLSLTAKLRSPDWIYTYLRAYYSDKSGKTNNYVYPGVAMPNVLVGLQGEMKPVYADVDGTEVVIGTEPKADATSFQQKLQQEKKARQFDKTIRDITNFLEFASEPNKLERHALGIKVILYLLVLLIIFVFLKKEYWRDVKR